MSDLTIFEFGVTERKRRKLLASILLAGIVSGYIFLGVMVTFSVASLFGLRFEFPEEITESGDNETIVIGMDLTVINEHWYSVDITDFSINISLYASDIHILDLTYTKDIIPRLTTTVLAMAWTIDLTALSEEKFEALNSTEEMSVIATISLVYLWTPLHLTIDLGGLF